MTRKKFVKRIGKKAELNFSLLNFLTLKLSFILDVTFFILIMVKMQIVTKIDSSDAEIEIMYQRFIYSRNGISFYDEQIKRLYPGVIDTKYFDQKYFEDNIEKSIYFGENNRVVGAKLTLLDLDGKIISITDTSTNSVHDAVVYYNKLFFDEKEVLYMAGQGFSVGKGGVKGKEFTVPVFIKENNAQKSGILKVLVIIQNV